MEGPQFEEFGSKCRASPMRAWAAHDSRATAKHRTSQPVDQAEQRKPTVKPFKWMGRLGPAIAEAWRVIKRGFLGRPVALEPLSILKANA